MLVLTIRTDKPAAEIGLYDHTRQLAYIIWPAHRQLAETIHLKLLELLASNGRQLSDIQAVVVYKGPGSFTGLRIGLSVANALADCLKIPITATGKNNWIEEGLQKIHSGVSEEAVQPEYGSQPHITQPKK